MAAPDIKALNKALKDKVATAKPMPMPEPQAAPEEAGMSPQTEDQLIRAGIGLVPQLLGFATGGAEGAELARKNVSDAFFEQQAAQARAASEAMKNAQAAALKQAELESELGMKKRKLDIDEYEAKTKRLGLEKEKKGKELTAQQTEAISGQDAALKQLDDLEALIGANAESMGPFAGRLGKLNPYNTTAKGMDAAAKLAAQNIGKSLEGGKLTDADIERYRAMLPNMTDAPEVAAEKLNIVRRLVMQRRQADLGAFGKAGYNVSNFEAVAPKSLSPNLLPKTKMQQAADAGIDQEQIKNYAKQYGLNEEMAAGIVLARKAAQGAKN